MWYKSYVSFERSGKFHILSPKNISKINYWWFWIGVGIGTFHNVFSGYYYDRYNLENINDNLYYKL